MKKLVSQLYLLLIYGSIYFPIIILIIYSFNEAKYSLQWQGFSYHWYRELFEDKALWFGFFNSVLLALTTAFIATSLGLLSVVNLFLLRPKSRHILHLILLFIIIIPDLVLGVALLIFFNFTAIRLGFFSLLIAHITFSLPLVILTINARLKTLDLNIYFSALDLGASQNLALRKVLFPLLWPAILSAFLLSFTLSFDDVIISYFVAGPEFAILPLIIYSLVRQGVTPTLNALCSIIFVISMFTVVSAYRLRGRR